MVRKFGPHLEGCIASGAAMGPVGVVIQEVSTQTTASCVHSRTQRTPETQYTCSSIMSQLLEEAYFQSEMHLRNSVILENCFQGSY